jgi:hypothetical protein
MRVTTLFWPVTLSGLIGRTKVSEKRSLHLGPNVSWIFSVTVGKFAILYVTPRQLSSVTFPIHYSSVILIFYVIQPEVIIAFLIHHK